MGARSQSRGPAPRPGAGAGVRDGSPAPRGAGLDVYDFGKMTSADLSLRLGALNDEAQAMQATIDREGRQAFSRSEGLRLDAIFAEFDATEAELDLRKRRLAEARAQLASANGSEGNRGAQLAARLCSLM